MNFPDLSKRFDSKRTWLTFSILYSLICTCVIIPLLKLLMVATVLMVLTIASPVVTASTYSPLQGCVIFGIMVIIWLAAHYFCGKWYVAVASAVGGSRRASLSQTLTIFTGVPCVLLLAYGIYVGLGVASFFALPLIAGELLFLTGMILSMRSIRNQNFTSI